MEVTVKNLKERGVVAGSRKVLVGRLATWLATIGATTYVQGQFFIATWGGTLIITSFAISIAVNALVTGLIVFEILKVFLEVKASSTSVERSLGSTRGSSFKAYHIRNNRIRYGVVCHLTRIYEFYL